MATFELLCSDATESPVAVDERARFWDVVGQVPADVWTLPSAPVAARVVSPSRLVGVVPGAPPEYVVRDELALLEETLASGGAAVVVAGIRGVGKSQLAAAYARRRWAAGVPLLVWIEAESIDKTTAGLAVLAERVGVADPGADLLTSARNAMDYLNQPDTRGLIVYDNALTPTRGDDQTGVASSSDQVAQVAAWIPTMTSCEVLITTTDRGFTSIARAVPVVEYTPEQARTYLSGRCPHLTQVDADRVAHELGWLPLALAQAGAVIAREHLTGPTYLDRLNTVQLDRSLPAVAGYPVSLAKAITLSLHLVEGNPVAAVAVTLMSLLDNDGVTRATLTALACRFVPGADVNEAIGALAEASLIGFSTDGDTIVMHRLIARQVG